MKVEGSIYQIKVTLLHTRPPIWRRILVERAYNLSDFHDVIQVAMGWTDSHLHQFIIGEKFYGMPDPAGWSDCVDERSVSLGEVLRKRKGKMMYEYDFGDGWLHEIVLEDILPAKSDAVYPLVVAGRRACPLEDCGGVGGYYHFLAAIQDPDHPDHKEMKEWWEDPFDPAAFDIDETNRVFHRG
ncbi:MAG: hypothetical protein BMS9Abin05_2500 [Rhodothermia bacterium]|nr:MAG: hypothetical protein BMS9Abin05_2500 [Rhodothermia bacterium]